MIDLDGEAFEVVDRAIDRLVADVDVEPTPEDLAAPRRFDTRTLPARFSHLKAAGSCGAHALHAFKFGGEDSLSKRLGNGTHAKVTGKPCVLWEEPSDAWIEAKAKAEKAGKPVPPKSFAPRSGGKWKLFAHKHSGAVILNRNEMAAAERMTAAILACGPARSIIQCPGDRIFERTILWSQCGRARRSTPDLRLGDGAFNCEIKTTRCAHPAVFWRDAKKLGYHAQLADQAEAIKYETGRYPRESFIVAVENTAPHVVQVYRVPRALLDEGAKLVNIWLERLQIYEATQGWSGYSERVEDLEFLEYPAPLSVPPVDDEEDDDPVE